MSAYRIPGTTRRSGRSPRVILLTGRARNTHQVEHGRRVEVTLVVPVAGSLQHLAISLK